MADTNFDGDSSDLGTPDDVETPNPMEGLGVNVFVPDVEVRMVNAGGLEEFEIWFAMASLFASAVVGFLVAYLQSFRTDAKGVEHSDPVLLGVTVLFFFFLVGSSIRAYLLRRRIQKKARSYAMRVTSI